MVSSANFAILTDSDDEVQSLVNNEYKIGDRTHPYGAPVLRTRTFEI